MGTYFTETENLNTRRLVGLALVIFLHLLVAYILTLGFNTTIVKPAEQPVELQIIQDIPPPPPPKVEEPKPEEKKPEPPKIVEKVAKVPEPQKTVETPKVTPVQKATPVAQAQPTQATPSPVASPSPVAAPKATAPAAAAPAKPAGVTRGVSDGEAGCEQPDYPREALMNEEQGTTRIAVLVDENGKVVDTKVKKSSGSKTLDKAAAKAWSKCTFKPAMKDGVPQKDWYELEYTFSVS